MNTNIQHTKDGSFTLFEPTIGETYHSIFGAFQETMHIFINAAFNTCIKSELTILEIGFGTGLNAYLTALETVNSAKLVHYHTVEKFPLPIETVMQLNYSKNFQQKKLQDIFEKIHKAAWEKEIEITENFRICKMQCDFTSFIPKTNYDIIYFDAFSPEKQPEMWTEERFKMIYEVCNRDAVLTTYCAKGIVRRALQNVGFKVERIPGPPGKREILRAIKK